MSNDLKELLDSLKNRPEECFKGYMSRIIVGKWAIMDYGYSPTITKIRAFIRTNDKPIFLSKQNKWVLERAVREWMDKNKSK